MDNYPKKTAFILEDDPDISLLISLILKDYKIDVYNADTLAKARNSLENISPAIFFIDQRIPDGLGFSIIPELRSKFPESFIIAMTANHTLELKDASYTLGADQYIEKPFKFSYLTGLIRNVL